MIQLYFGKICGFAVFASVNFQNPSFVCLFVQTLHVK
jgi:hypothetical protein